MQLADWILRRILPVNEKVGVTPFAARDVCLRGRGVEWSQENGKRLTMRLKSGA
jgi:hypothetical protein